MYNLDSVKLKFLFFVILINVLLCYKLQAGNNVITFNSKHNNNFPKIKFIENAGQFKTINSSSSPDLLFKIESQGVAIYLTTKGLTYFFAKQQLKQSSSNTINNDSIEYQYNRFDIDLQNASIKKESIVKEFPSTTDYNFFYPHCKQGIMSVKEYGKLTIQNVYPGIDWVLYSSSEKGLKYDFIVHSGADAQQIRFLYKSLNPLKLQEDGTIALNTSFGNFMDSAPKCFLQKKHSEIMSSYKFTHSVKKNFGDNIFYETEIGFNLEAYPKNETLIIDPLQLWWGTYYGGTSGSEGNSVTTDSLGNLFVLGSANSLDLPLQPYGTLAYFQGTYAGNNNGGGMGDMFILKFTNAGQLLWATYFGGKNIDEGQSIKCDKNGNIFVLGKTYSVDFPLKDAGGGAYYDTINGTSDWLPDLFLGKFSNSGQYLWGTYYGGDDYEWAGSLSIDIYNNVYFTGTTNSDNLPVFNAGSGAFFQGSLGATFSNNVNDAVILKFSNTGQRLLASYFGGDSFDDGFSTDCDSNGNVYFCGKAGSSNLFTLNPGSGAFFQGSHTGSTGNYNGYLLKLNSNCQPIWSTYIAGNGNGICNTIICDKSNNLFMTGRFGNSFPTVNPGGGAYFLANSLMTPLVITKFNTQSQMVWGTYFGTWGTDGYATLTLGSCDEIYTTFVGGSICSTCPPMQVTNPGNGVYCDSTYNNDYNMSLPDIFIGGFTNSGVLKWGTFFGGIGNEQTMYMTCDKFGNIFYTGQQGYYYYNDSIALQSYSTDCIKDPGGTSYFQGAPSTSFPDNNNTYAYCVIGEFTNPYPSLNISTTGCNNNDSIIVTQNSGWPSYTCNWSNGDTTTYLTNISNGTYTCTITDDFFGCKQEQQIYFGTPIISVTSLSDSICLSQSTQLTVQGADTYNWIPNSSLSSSTGSTVTASPNTLTIYTVTGITNSNCSATNTISVVVNPLPNIIVSGNDSICKNNSTSLNAIGAVNYSWSPNIGLTSTTGSNVIANPNQTQTYTVLGTNIYNCIDTTLFTLKIIPVPQLQIIGSQSICIGNTATLSASGANQFLWDFGTSQTTNTLVVLSPTINTTYSLFGTNSGICKDSIPFTISVFQLPNISLQAIDSICQGEEVMIQANGNGNFNWQPSNGLSCNQCSNPIVIVQSSTQYVVTITDNNMCSNRDSTIVKVKESCGDNILIPNVFSPNADGSNDLFKVTVNNIKMFECEIYDRWGLKLFTSNDSSISWNGITPNNLIAPEGVYFYLIKITKFNNQVRDFKGHLTLVR